MGSVDFFRQKSSALSGGVAKVIDKGILTLTLFLCNVVELK